MSEIVGPYNLPNSAVIGEIEQDIEINIEDEMEDDDE